MAILRGFFLPVYLGCWMGIALACNGRTGSCYIEDCARFGTSSKTLGECIQRDQKDREVPCMLQGLASSIETIEGSLNEEKTLLRFLAEMNERVETGEFPNPVVYICEDDVFLEVISCSDPPMPWVSRCSGFTSQENAVRRSPGGGVAMIVSKPLLGDQAFTRFVFNSEELLQTKSQGSWHDPSVAFSCTQRPWYNENKCNDPLGTTCEYQFASTPLLGATQFYGYGTDGEGRCGVLATDVAPDNVGNCLS